MDGRCAGVTTSSRHWGDLDAAVGWEMGRGPVGVSMVADWVGFGATDWKAWMGRASKNS
jgi:hypothetical protein